MKFLTQILFVTFLFGVGCKTVDQTQNLPQSLSYNQQKAFDKVFFDASKQKILNNREKALTLYSEALRLNSSCHACMYELSVLNYEQKNYLLALDYSQKAVLNSTEYNTWYFNLVAKSYTKLGMFAQSAAVFSEMTTFEPDERSNYLRAADAYSRIRSYDKATLVLQNMQDHFGIEHASSMKLESIFSSMGEIEKAIEELRRISIKYPKKIIYLGRMSDIYLRNKQVDEAITVLNEIIEIDSTSGKANFALYLIYLGKDDSKSFKYLKKSLESDDINLDTKLQALSPLLKSVKSDSRKKSDLKELSATLLKSYPSKSEVYFFLADMHIALKDYKLARIYTRKALERDSVSYAIWKKIIYLDEHLFDYRQQLKDVNKALYLFPNIARLYFIKSKALIELSEYESALKTANEGLDFAVDQSDKTDLMVAKGQSYFKLGQYKKSSQLLNAVLSIDPNHILGLRAYSHLLIIQGGQLDKALNTIEKALIFQPKNPDLIATKAEIWFLKKNTTKALSFIDNAILINPNNKKYYQQKKVIYESMGNQMMVEQLDLKIKDLHE
ncbi:MAG: tetratricopeptide repeat protein [Bacteroidia bacterium]|nr:tetratricopeptide repeat protein [Bacteroidia bacterium]